jgi:hypothetical protein
MAKNRLLCLDEVFFIILNKKVYKYKQYVYIIIMNLTKGENKMNTKNEHIHKCDKCNKEYDALKSQGIKVMQNCVYKTLPPTKEWAVRQRLVSNDWGHYCYSCYENPLASLYRW